MTNDQLALQELLRVTQSGKSCRFRHYLYFDSQPVAAKVAERVRGSGFETEERLGADQTSWLVLAIHSVPPSTEGLASAREELNALAVQYGGEYDGWEAEAIPDTP